MFRYLLTIALTFVVFSASASAHPGHGSPVHADGVMHYATSPLHAGSALIVVAVMLCGRKLLALFADRLNGRR